MIEFPTLLFSKKSRTPLIKYKIEVVTSDKLWAGTDDTVKINLKGSKGTSEFRKLDNAWKNDFERGSTSKFELEMADLGRSSTNVQELTLQFQVSCNRFN